MARKGKQPHPLEKQIEGMAAINCTWAEIEAVTGIPDRTLRRKFGLTYKKGRETGKSSLKRKMWDIAVNNGNVTMCIWLSKQMLGYTDKIEEKIKRELMDEAEKLSKMSTPELVKTIDEEKSKVSLINGK